MEEELITRIHDYILRHDLIAAGDGVVVAVSGGADSLCLLRVLHALMHALGCRLHVAHLDHALRAGSAADARFVAVHAADLGLPCTVARRDAAAVAREQRISLEAAARLVRYRFLREVAAATGSAAIATGHTRDDQAETVLLHLARGSGLAGLAGMLPRREGVVRPLLEVSHVEALAYCAVLGLQPREDESNQSPAYARNRVRHEVMPRLEAIQPAASANIARAAQLLAADLALIERLARRALARAVVTQGAPVARTATKALPMPDPAHLCAMTSRERRRSQGRTGSGVTLSVPRWAEAEPELQPHMLRLLLADLLGHAEGFDARHYALALRALAPNGPGTTLTLPRGLMIRRCGDEAILGPAGTAALTPLPPLGTYLLAVPGSVETEAGVLRAERAPAPHSWTDLSPRVAYLDLETSGASLTVRAWRAGDRVRPLGLSGTRKVQDVFVDRKVPRALRGRIPIVEGPRGIAWVAGLCTGEPYRATAGAAAVRLTWEPGASGPCPGMEG